MKTHLDAQPSVLDTVGCSEDMPHTVAETSSKGPGSVVAKNVKLGPAGSAAASGREWREGVEAI